MSRFYGRYGRKVLRLGIIGASSAAHQLVRFDPERLHKLLKDFQTGLEGPLFKLAKIASANFSLKSEIVRRKRRRRRRLTASMFKRVTITLAFAYVRQ